jgi:hypothetical protein
MDLATPLAALRKELEAVSATIIALEAIKDRKVPSAVGKRGRKSMGEAERAVVSERMKRYWSTRRSANGQTTPKALNACP